MNRQPMPLVRNCWLVWFGVSGLCLLSACQFHARSADDYRRATRQLLETRNADVKQCYDAALKKDKAVSGVVVVKFQVEADSGKLISPSVVEGRTTAPESLSQCVVDALGGLQLEPPDARTGEAEYSWEFQVDKG